MTDEEVHVDISEIDFSDLEAKYSVVEQGGLDVFVVVDGAPIVPKSKVEVLTKVLRKLFNTVGKVKPDGIFMPLDDNEKSQGFLFVEFETPQQANAAVLNLNRKRLDQNHTLFVNKLTDIENFGTEGKVSEEYHEEPEEDYVDSEHLRSWLADPQGRDQIVLHMADDVGIYWHRKRDKPEKIELRHRWTDKYVKWSPQGTYLATVHQQGIQLWGGPSFKRIARFPHLNVTLIDFSPCEKYLVTWSSQKIENGAPPFTPADEGKQIVIWNIATGLPERTFAMTAEAVSKREFSWPMFKWSPDDKYFARATPGQSLAVFETPSMGMVDKKTIKIEGIVDFEWCPAKVTLENRQGAQPEHILCYWTPEIGDQSARVSIMSIPSKKAVRSSNLFNVSDCKLHWQSKGDYLCVKVDRHTKTKKSIFSNLEFFRLKEKGIPVELIELKDTVVNLDWEPNGDRFVVIAHGEAPAATQPVLALGGMPPPGPVARTTISFYGLERSKGIQGGFKLIESVEKRNVNAIFWSPRGRFVVLCNISISPPLNCELDFYDLDYEGERKNETAENKDVPANLQLVESVEHFGMTDVQWDPSGRFLATSSSFWRHAAENGYKIWDVKGKLLSEESIQGFKEFLWRPRPHTLLSKEEMKKIRKNLREYSKQFEQIDAFEQSESSRELIEHRRRQLSEWRAWRAQVGERLEELGGISEEQARKASQDNKTVQVTEEVMEEVLEEKEEDLDENDGGQDSAKNA